MPLPRRLRYAVLLFELRLPEALRLPRRSIERQKVGANAIDERPKRRLVVTSGETARASRRQRREVGREHGKLRMAQRPGVEKVLETARDTAQQIRETLGRPAAGDLRRQVFRSELQKAPQDVSRHEPAVDKCREPFPKASLTQLHEHHRHVVICPCEMAPDSQRAIERLTDEP